MRMRIRENQPELGDVGESVARNELESVVAAEEDYKYNSKMAN